MPHRNKAYFVSVQLYRPDTCIHTPARRVALCVSVRSVGWVALTPTALALSALGCKSMAD